MIARQSLFVVTWRTIIGFGLGVTLSFATTNCVNAEGDKLDRLIADVQAGEALFRDIDIALQERYQLLGRPYGGGEGWMPTKESLEQVQYVSQRGKQRLDIAQETIPYEGAPRRKIRILAYDGNKTRILSGKTANVRNGYFASGDQVQPHMMLLRNAGYKFSLSTYLRGDDAIRAAPSGDRWPKYRSVNIELLEDDHVLQENVLSVQHACIHTLPSTQSFKIIENQKKRAYIQTSRPVAFPANII